MVFFFSHLFIVAPLELLHSWLLSSSQRGQFGQERYEKDDFQRQVRAKFMTLMDEDKVSSPSAVRTYTVLCTLEAFRQIVLKDVEVSLARRGCTPNIYFVR